MEGTHIRVAVNVSPRQLADDDFERHVRAALAASGLPPERLTLEVTESAVIADPGRAVEKLARLKALGVRLALDDFGVGESSLSQLRALKPIDTLKIDKSFVDGVASDSEDFAIVRAVVELARSLGMRTVGEGIEEPAQAAALRELGCTVGQGYHFARPLPAADVPDFVRAQAPRFTVTA
jgi:EAL domain-containing protein (putative c-di-GMP-specific phosphodiesterase class I)